MAKSGEVNRDQMNMTKDLEASFDAGYEMAWRSVLSLATMKLKDAKSWGLKEREDTALALATLYYELAGRAGHADHRHWNDVQLPDRVRMLEKMLRCLLDDR